MGAPSLVKVPKEVKDPIQIVFRELAEGTVPLTVIRKMPNGEEMLLDIKGEVFG